jgi:hypothetical protein
MEKQRRRGCAAGDQYQAVRAHIRHVDDRDAGRLAGCCSDEPVAAVRNALRVLAWRQDYFEIAGAAPQILVGTSCACAETKHGNLSISLHLRRHVTPSLSCLPVLRGTSSVRTGTPAAVSASPSLYPATARKRLSGWRFSFTVPLWPFKTLERL